MSNFRHIEHPCMESMEAKKMLKKYDEMVELLGV